MADHHMLPRKEASERVFFADVDRLIAELEKRVARLNSLRAAIAAAEKSTGMRDLDRLPFRLSPRPGLVLLALLTRESISTEALIMIARCAGNRREAIPGISTARQHLHRVRAALRKVGIEIRCVHGGSGISAQHWLASEDKAKLRAMMKQSDG